MSANSFKKILCATVSALALVTAFAPPAMAFSSVTVRAANVATMHRSSQEPNVFQINEAYQRINHLIESASPSRLATAEKDVTEGSVTSETWALYFSNSTRYRKYATQCQKEINPNNAISAPQVTKSIRQDFLNCIHQKEVIDVASAQPQSHGFSLNGSLLAQCQSAYGVKPGQSLTHNFNQAKDTYACVTSLTEKQVRQEQLNMLLISLITLGTLAGGFMAYGEFQDRKFYRELRKSLPSIK